LVEKDSFSKIKGIDTMSPEVIRCKNYHRWIYNNIRHFIGNRVMEIGGNAGYFTKFLLKKDLIISIDICDDCVEQMKSLFLSTNIKIYKGDICEYKIVELAKNESIDTIICINVLEHIEDDFKAIKHMYHILVQSKGTLILLVPAFQGLYGTLDKSGGHYRRYSSKKLNAMLNEIGFTIKKQFYMNSIGVIGWYLNGKVFKVNNYSRVVSLQIRTFDSFAIPFLEKIESLIKIPFGQSLITVCRA
jgi:phospholipid N-methyltransferase